MQFTTENLHEANDFIINKVMQSADIYDDDIVSRAKEIFEERGLGSEQKQKEISRYNNLKDKVFLSLKNGGKLDDEVDFLMNNGFEKAQAEALVSQMNVKATEATKEEESKQSWGTVLTVIFLVLFVIRMIMRMAG